MVAIKGEKKKTFFFFLLLQNASKSNINHPHCSFWISHFKNSKTYCLHNLEFISMTWLILQVEKHINFIFCPVQRATDSLILPCMPCISSTRPASAIAAVDRIKMEMSLSLLVMEKWGNRSLILFPAGQYQRHMPGAIRRLASLDSRLHESAVAVVFWRSRTDTPSGGKEKGEKVHLMLFFPKIAVNVFARIVFLIAEFSN